MREWEDVKDLMKFETLCFYFKYETHFSFEIHPSSNPNKVVKDLYDQTYRVLKHVDKETEAIM